MRNALRVAAFDVVAPLVAIAALLMIGVALDWPLWWVSLCSILALLIVQGMVVNFALARRDKVTMGTDDEGPGLRLAVVGLTTVALAVAATVTYTHWTVPERERSAGMAQVVQVAAGFAESAMTFNPQDPMGSVNKAADLMDPERGAKFKDASSKAVTAEAAKNISTRALTVSAGVEAISAEEASVAVVMRATRNVPGQDQDNAVIALRVVLSNSTGQWRVLDFTPISPPVGPEPAPAQPPGR